MKDLNLEDESRYCMKKELEGKQWQVQSLLSGQLQEFKVKMLKSSLILKLKPCVSSQILCLFSLSDKSLICAKLLLYFWNRMKYHNLGVGSALLQVTTWSDDTAQKLGGS